MNEPCGECQYPAVCGITKRCQVAERTDCASDAMQRSCLAAQPGDDPVTDEPPHLADRRLAELREMLDDERFDIGTDLCDCEKNTVEWKELNARMEELVWVIEIVDALLAPAAEAREERPSGRPNAQDDSRDLSR